MWQPLTYTLPLAGTGCYKINELQLAPNRPLECSINGTCDCTGISTSVGVSNSSNIYIFFLHCSWKSW